MHRPRLTSLAPGAALALALLSSPTAAQADGAAPSGLPPEIAASCARASTPAEQETAKVAARVAAQFFERGDWDKAIRYFTQAYAADCATPAVLLGLADAHEKKGDKVTSTAILELYLKRSADPAKPTPTPAPTPAPAPAAPSASPPPSVPLAPPAEPAVVPPPPAPAKVEPVTSTPPAGTEGAAAPPGSTLAEARTLKGHVFLYPALLDAPFVQTSARLGTELSAFSQRGVSVVAADSAGLSRVFTYDRDGRVVVLHFGAGFAIGRHFGFDLDGTYTAFAGGNEQSTFLYGSSTGDDLRPSMRIKILRLSGLGTQIGARVHGLVAHTTRLRPAGVLEEVAKQIRGGSPSSESTDCLAAVDFSCAFRDGFSAADSIRISRAQFGGGASVSAAQPLGSRFGVLASLGADFSTAKLTSLVAGEVRSTPIEVYAGVAPSVDLSPTLPLGAMIEYRFAHRSETFSGSNNAAPGSAKSLQHGVSAGLYYTGRPEIQLGVLFAGSFVQSSGSDPLATTLGGRLVGRYFF